jgi:hypothetical protein
MFAQSDIAAAVCKKCAQPSVRLYAANGGNQLKLRQLDDLLPDRMRQSKFRVLRFALKSLIVEVNIPVYCASAVLQFSKNAVNRRMGASKSSDATRNLPPLHN